MNIDNDIHIGESKLEKAIKAKKTLNEYNLSFWREQIYKNTQSSGLDINQLIQVLTMGIG